MPLWPLATFTPFVFYSTCRKGCFRATQAQGEAREAFGGSNNLIWMFIDRESFGNWNLKKTWQLQYGGSFPDSAVPVIEHVFRLENNYEFG
jgi:hypothetical protein